MTYSDSYPTALSETSFELAVRAASVLRLKLPRAPERQVASLAVRTVFCRCIDCGCEKKQCERSPILDAVIAEVERRLRVRDLGDYPMTVRIEATAKARCCHPDPMAAGEISPRPNPQCAFQDTP